MNRAIFAIRGLLALAMLSFLFSCQSVDPKQAVVNAFEKLKATESYYFKRTITMKNPSPVRLIHEFSHKKPDKYLLKLTAGILPQSDGYLLLGDDAYAGTYINDIQIMKKVAETGKVREMIESENVEKEDTSKFSDFKYIETVDMNGRGVMAIVCTYSPPKGLARKIWISTETGLPLKIANVPIKNTELNIDTTGEDDVIEFNYSKIIDLKPPLDFSKIPVPKPIKK